MCTQMLMHVIAHKYSIRESALKVWLWEKNPLLHWGLKHVSVLRLFFQLDVLPTITTQSFYVTELFQNHLWKIQFVSGSSVEDSGD